MAKIRQINKQLDRTRPQNKMYNLIAKMDRWKYGFVEQVNEINGDNIVTREEWLLYKDRELKYALERDKNEQKVKKELNDLEKIIRQGNGFMEVEFTEDLETEIQTS